MCMARGKKGSDRLAGKGSALNDLKNRILQTLHKLSDRDTQQQAVEELERIARRLTPEGITLFLACLYDTDAQHRSAVRRDCLRLVGTLAALHGDLLACHLPKMVGNIIRRLKDPDSNIREACVETIGTLASQVGVGVGVDVEAEAEAATNVFVKPLLEALAEQHPNLQAGASMCLAQVIRSLRNPDPWTLQRLCPRIVRWLASPNFLAKAALWNAVGVMVQVPGVVSLSQQSILIGFAQEELVHNEWAIRKAAADTLSCMAATSTAGAALGMYRENVLAALENARFDKVKPVRDSVYEALRLWKSVYPTNGMHGALPSRSHKSRTPTGVLDGDFTLPLSDIKNALLKGFGIAMNAPFCNPSEELKPLPDKCANALKKKPQVIGNQKANPEFFRKEGGAEDSIEWQVGIAPPQERSSPPRVCAVTHESSVRRCGITNGDWVPRCGTTDEDSVHRWRVADANTVHHHHRNCEAPLPRSSPASDASCATLRRERCREDVDLSPDPNRSERHSQPVENGKTASDGYQDLRPDHPLECVEKWEDPHVYENGEYVSRWDADVAPMNSVEKAVDVDMVSVHQHFYSLERQQLSLMEMLQESMIRVQEGMQNLEARLSRLEHAEGRTAQGSSNAEGRSAMDELLPLPTRPPHGPHPGGPHFPEGRVDEHLAAPPPRARSPASSRSTACGDSDEFTFVRTGPPAADRAGPRGRPSPPRPGEGPSTRSLWRAASPSRDEAIAAIRGAATPSRPPGRHPAARGPGGQAACVGGPFWVLWSRAMESAQSGELDVAYAGILGSGDELLLVRLMGHTGPVWDQLGASTVSELLARVRRFLQQQSFLDCVLPWLEQVSDLVLRRGPEALGPAGETKDLVWALQKATTMEYAQSWMGAKIAELAEQLGKAG